MTVTLVQLYDPAWPVWFRQIAAFIEPALAGVAHAIEHVGSTAVPGMVAKPIIDLDIVVTTEVFPAAKAGLESLGYIHQKDLGIPKREAFKETLDPIRLPPHHLYVCEADCYELQKHLVFRDFLRNHPEWVERFSQHKMELCVTHDNDRQAYMAGKSAMVEEITRLAMENM